MNDYKEFEKNNNLAINNCKKYRQMIDQGELPTYNWVKEKMFGGDTLVGIFMGCNAHAIFQIYTKEFIETLAKDIKALKPKKILEVGAGDGRLSYFLNRYGVNSKPIDDYKWEKTEDQKEVKGIRYPKEVEKIDFKDALKREQPDTVIICWEELGAKFTIDILEYPSVKNVIWIGEFPGGCTGNEETFNRFKHEDLNNPYCLARTDHRFGDEMNEHTTVYKFENKEIK